ncbi:hypothetical protein BV25DRAFT_1827732 [Artomyces pyxidatus]|uniref:Uncharacterized protein n=1 Tax=Artomyces pyxidatus TaxID=48021 RepID=A0ACB8SWN4_9AGAM|nr:hypothetical protein BV25DRAFT_1827732 [Artomyces pyxidatus]
MTPSVRTVEQISAIILTNDISTRVLRICTILGPLATHLRSAFNFYTPRRRASSRSTLLLRHFHSFYCSDKSSIAMQVPASVIVWLVFQIAGPQVLLPILIGTFLFSKARRDVTLINLAATFCVSGVCGSLLLYTNEFVGPEPNKSLCIFQAAAVDASPPMWATAALALVLHVRFTVKEFLGMRTQGMPWTVTSLVAPYVVFIAALIGNVVVGIRNPDRVSRARRQRYCDLASDSSVTPTVVITGLIFAVVTALSCPTFLRVYRFSGRISRSREQLGPIKLAIRLFIFLTYAVGGSIFCFWSTVDHNDVTARDIYGAIAGVVFFFIFATSRDILHVWGLWPSQGQEEDAHSKLRVLRRLSDARGNGDVEMVMEEEMEFPVKELVFPELAHHSARPGRMSLS